MAHPGQSIAVASRHDSRQDDGRKPIHLLIADDDQDARQCLRMLRDVPDIVIVGEASSGSEAVTLVEATRPDVVLMDVRMPGGDGISATRALTSPDAPHRVSVVVMTSLGEDEYLFEALEAGACGLLPKRSSPEDFTRAIRSAAKGEGMLSPVVTRRIVAEFARLSRHARDERTRSACDAELTSREVEVLRALARGLSDRQIADELCLERTTVKAHLAHLRTKTGARNRTALLLWGFRSGLVDFPTR